MANYRLKSKISLSIVIIFIVDFGHHFKFCNGENCDTLKPKLNRKLKGKIITTLSAIGIKQCSKRCSLTTGCLSFNYRRSNLSCELNSADERTDVLDIDENYEYYTRPEASKVVTTGECAKFTCAANSQCVEITGYGPYCYISHCDTPHDVPLAKLTPGSNSVGHTRAYVCDAGYAMIGHAEITCQTDATWTSIQFMCRDCGNPPSKDSATLSSGNNLVGTTRSYTCWTEHRAEGTNSITCKTNGQWSSSDLYCRQCTNDYTYVAELALCYKIIRAGLSYYDAERYCKENGATLLKVDSYLKFQYFADQFGKPEWDGGKGSPGWGLWVDGKYRNRRWEDGTGVKLENIFWEPNAPAEPYSNSCMNFAYTSNGLWIYNRQCVYRYDIICQYGP